MVGWAQQYAPPSPKTKTLVCEVLCRLYTGIRMDAQFTKTTLLLKISSQDFATSHNIVYFSP